MVTILIVVGSFVLLTIAAVLIHLYSDRKFLKDLRDEGFFD